MQFIFAEERIIHVIARFPYSIILEKFLRWGNNQKSIGIDKNYSEAVMITLWKKQMSIMFVLLRAGVTK
jgi:hypothetical protein